ncbi:helix-turn-helix domain-containing protein [Idiomarina aminovorans]|uniref:helix-turn-helix domain-containing protein n=1 Tax=Idiomarina aminovorans TaxID=2914829 RepID=UPI0020053674|nr:helix-turn-helix domain-containing protein [Idiomarina sp. ATCH4]MCK7460403.1 helix-turn-helix domain-containing protein [Idiomarina sp. ATCH4]
MRSPIQCSQCSMQSICVPAGLVPTDVEILDKCSREPHLYNKRNVIFNEGQKLNSVFAIKSGSVKCYTIDSNGKQQITSFHMVGDIVGLESLASGSAATYCETMETSMLCEIKLIKLFAQELPKVESNLLQLMSRRLANCSKHYLNIVNTSAEQKVVAFLLSISTHMHQHGLSRSEYRLPMTRTDIANYLGLAVETVSRIFTALKEQQLINTEQSILTINDFTALERRVA